MLDRIEGAPEGSDVVHREYDAGHDHGHQHDAGERAKNSKDSSNSLASDIRVARGAEK